MMEAASPNVSSPLTLCSQVYRNCDKRPIVDLISINVNI